MLLFQGQSALAAGNLQGECPGDYVWRELDSQSFVILYTASNVTLAKEIEAGYIQTVEAELPLYEAAFGTQLDIPITIRLYPTLREYGCLNALAPILTEDDSHSHIGSREIALIATVINRSPMTWEEQAVNALRHELAVLFGEQISSGEAPPGLLQGLGGYFENPQETFPRRFTAVGEIAQPDRGLQRLWEEDSPASNSLVLVQQTSIISYLIEVFGWEQFVAFLARIGELQGYRQASVDVFGVGTQDLETLWLQYFPAYVESRWQNNVVHDYDLGVFEQLIAAGAYTDAAEMLARLYPMLALFGEDDQPQQASALLEKAQSGVLAGDLTLEARQALLAGDYPNAYAYAQEAQVRYQQLNDARREEEISIYLSLASEVLTLREELVLLRGDGSPLDPVRSQRIAEIGRRLGELGDKEGTRQAQLAFLLLGTSHRDFVQWVTVVGLVVCVFLLWRRFKAARSRSNEVSLL